MTCSPVPLTPIQVPGVFATKQIQTTVCGHFCPFGRWEILGSSPSPAVGNPGREDSGGLGAGQTQVSGMALLLVGCVTLGR